MSAVRDLDDILARGYVDTRDLIERFEYLDAEEDRDEDEQEEWSELEAICEDGGQLFPDWPYGETLIAERDFVEYAQQLAEDIGAVGSDLQWPLYAIDWDQAAEDLKQDYSVIEIRGVDYYGRA